MSYRTTQEADEDIIALYETGADGFGIAQAERYLAALFDTFALLADNPHLAREHRELTPPIRLHPFQAHLIAYLVQADGILIVRVVNGRQDWESLFS